MLRTKEHITIIGAGLVGSLLSMLLVQKGYVVKVYEKRPDPTKAKIEKGRSINLALSDRGIRTLDLAGITQKAMKLTIPMEGRLMHEPNGQLVLQPYGKEDQQIYSISRSELTKLLIEEAKGIGVVYNFNVQLDKIDFSTKVLHLTENQYNLSVKEPYQVLFGADGAFSVVRNELKASEKLDSEIEALEHSYKELHIPPTGSSGHRMYKNALHIWPRKQFMLIALPNLDGSFTVTLFLPTEGDLSFEYLNNKENLESFFLEYFPDAYALIPDLTEQFYTNPTSFLGTVKSWPWILEDQIALIGDAAHAIVPFYGQGMNASFEDCRILIELIAHNTESNWADILQKFQLARKENADAIADLAVANFYEMRDRVVDENFLLRKKIEIEIQKQYPEYMPLYSMVTFSHLPYSEAYLRGKKQDAFMDKVMSQEHLAANSQDEKHWKQIIEMGINEGVILKRN